MTKLEYYLYSILDQIEKDNANIESFRQLKKENPDLVKKYEQVYEACKKAEIHAGHLTD